MEDFAIQLALKRDADKPALLCRLGRGLRAHFERYGDIHALQLSVTRLDLANRLTPLSHAEKSTRLAELGTSLRTRYNHQGQIDDLELALASHRLAVCLAPEGRVDKPAWLREFGRTLGTRFRRFGALNDLEHTIILHQQAIELTPEGHPDKPARLASLAVSLEDRYRRHGELDDLKRAISTQERALELTPEGHPHKPERLASLAVSLVDRYRHCGELSDLERAITFHQHAVELTPVGHPAKPERLASLGVSLEDRYRRHGELQDLERAINVQELALELTPEAHPDLVIRLYNLGLYLTTRFESQRSKLAFDAAVGRYMEATVQSLGNPSDRLDSAQACLSLLSEYAEFGSVESLLLAHSRIIQVFPEIVWLGHNIDRRFEESAKLGFLVNDAVSAFIQARSRYQAIEWMEAGRSLVWSQISSLRAPMDDEKLKKAQPDLAAALHEVLRQLGHSGYTPRSSSQNSRQAASWSQLARSDGAMLVAGPEPTSESTTATSLNHRQLVIQYESLLNKIRSHSGLENFMRSPGINSLFPRIEHLDGLVVFINVHASSCDVLALFPNGAIRHVSLPSLTETRARSLRFIWLRCLRSSDRGVRAVVPHDIRTLRGGTSMLGRVLGRLWVWIVHPILQALRFMDSTPPDRLPHVTWCPTGPLTQLPLHAAGIYDITQADRPRVFNFVVSSYTPSLAALLRCRESSSTPSTQPNVLVVAQPATPGLSPLPGTHDECARIQKLLPASNFLKHGQATKADTLSVMNQYPWLHLACHGFQDKRNPTQSAFALYDSRLTLSALMETVAENAELAFLSACETAVGDEKIPEESAHLAAGMLAVGFKGVIATMWSIGDADAPVIVEAYYKKLLELRTSGDMAPGYTGAAYALHEAVKVLRERVGEQDFVKWAPFVHFGV